MTKSQVYCFFRHKCISVQCSSAQSDTGFLETVSGCVRMQSLHCLPV